VNKLTNLSKIANIIWAAQGKPVPSTQIRRALCQANSKAYHRGMYCAYFSAWNGYGKAKWDQSESNVLWQRRFNLQGNLLGWVLTAKGLKHLQHGEC
jgi:hypothetical protein